LTDELQACFADVDALLSPSITGPAPAADSTGNPAFQAPWSYTGVPTVSFLAGHSPERLPLAIQVAGRPWSEASLFRVAAWCEQTLGLEIKEPPG
jgi:aspartyl-tRNA(Asn)/glutamyl-tRNA(Gln) amidotransferase subunit A